MVDRSLETLAADRGVTIAFADLDGVDGLWLPDERTILVSRRLSERRAAEVLDHELTHVDIEDGHTALDAAVRRRARRTRLASALAAAASAGLLVGIRLLLAGQPSTLPDPPPQAGFTSTPHQTAQPQFSSPAAPATPSGNQVFGRGAQPRTVTVTVRATTPSLSPTPARSATASVTPETSPTANPMTATPSSPPPTTSSAVTTASASTTPSATAPAATSAQAQADASPQASLADRAGAAPAP